MPQGNILPEGFLMSTPEIRSLVQTPEGLERACREGTVLEGIADRCDAEHNLYVALPCATVCIPRSEAALGIAEGTARDIAVISRVGKPVCFRLYDVCGLHEPEPTVFGSRADVSREARDCLCGNLHPGEVIRARVTHLEPFGCFADIGRGVVSMIGADRISVSRIRHAGERFRTGQDIYAVVLSTDETTGRIDLSHRELLGTWEQNACMFSPGETVRGIVRGVENYGIFVELTPNLSGLAEPCPGVNDGDVVSVFIKSISPERMKIKLVIIDHFSGERIFCPPRYFITGGRIPEFRYAPAVCTSRNDETFFCAGCTSEDVVIK